MFNINYLLNPSCCGYFCLKHILRGKKIKKSKLMSIYEISEILKEYSYYCICVRVNDIKNMVFDCLTLLKKKENVYHYIVVKNIKNNFVYIYDPLYLGIKKIRVDTFRKKWSHICLFYSKI